MRIELFFPPRREAEWWSILAGTIHFAVPSGDRRRKEEVVETLSFLPFEFILKLRGVEKAGRKERITASDISPLASVDDEKRREEGKM